MLPKWHILFGLVFVFILAYFFNFSLIQGVIIFLSSVLIDIDHYFRYIILKKDFSLKGFWSWSMQNTKKWNELSYSQKKDYKLPVFIFHGIEFWILIFLLIFVNRVFFWSFLGIMIHMLFDFIDIIYKKDPLYIKMSQIYIWITNKNKKNLIWKKN